jgi:hypothetical protein
MPGRMEAAMITNFPSPENLMINFCVRMSADQRQPAAAVLLKFTTSVRWTRGDHAAAIVHRTNVCRTGPKDLARLIADERPLRAQ